MILAGCYQKIIKNEIESQIWSRGFGVGFGERNFPFSNTPVFLDRLGRHFFERQTNFVKRAMADKFFLHRPSFPFAAQILRTSPISPRDPSLYTQFKLSLVIDRW